MTETLPLSVCGILQRDGLVLVAKRRAGGELGGMWEFPGGKVDPGEEPYEALEREFFEELGLGIEVVSFLGEGQFQHGELSVKLLAFQVASSGEPALGPEHTELRWVLPGDLYHMDLVGSDTQVLSWLLGRGQNC